MFKLIINTLGTKLVTVLANILIMVIASRNLGSANMGNISLIVLSVVIFLQINNIVAGPALVYLLPRFETGSILLLSYFWLLITTGIGSGTIFILELIPKTYFFHVVVLAIIYSLLSIHLTILLSKEKIKTHNYILTGNTILLLLTLSIFIYLFHEKNIYAYIIGLYVAYGLSLLVSTIMLIINIKKIRIENVYGTLRALFKYGSIMQLSNILQLLNYRMNYFLIERFWNKSILGVYSVGNQISEGIWIFSNSASTVLYPKISNSKESNYAAYTTLFFMKITAIVTLVLISVLFTLPVQFYTYIFGNEFNSVKTVILSVSFGIFFLAVSKIMSNFFSGTGKPHINTISSGIGLVIVTIFGLVLIPRWAFVGAGITASVTYFASFLFQFIIFVKNAKLTLRDFMLTKQDIDAIKLEVIKIIKK
ncbi:MAG TPA: hypothetical protein EYP69_00395 [Bacteroidales bacterium]|nr:hypothetical protein [Bacteroidales bacterium]